MPAFTFIQVVISRIVVGIAVILTALGLGSISDSTTQPIAQEDTTEQVVTIEDSYPIPQEASIVPKDAMEGETLVNTPELTEDIEDITTETKTNETKDDTLPSNAENTAINTEATNSSNIVDPPVAETTPPITPFLQINTDTAKTLVNILCSQQAVGAVTPITGSGVIIDPRGVVITNAHVAQFFLLKDYPVENGLKCILRTGSPARHTYTAELLYIPPEWINLHASDITKSEPKGTGEHDYAFLRITGRTDPNLKLSTKLPFVSIDTNNMGISTGDNVLAAAYPAGFLGGISIQRDLYSVSSIATVGELFTFVENTIDLISIGGTVVSQRGSSGGAVVSDKNKLIGIIVTSTQADTTAERDLRAITTGYINNALIENAGTTIEGLLFGDIALKAKLFNMGTAKVLTNVFLQYLTN